MVRERQQMKRLLFGVAALPLLAGIALAHEPVQLTNTQMDKVTAGFSLREIDVSNTSWTQVSIYSSALTPCSECFLSISNPAFSVESKFGPSPP
jgi:hypothetical protein